MVTTTGGDDAARWGDAVGGCGRRGELSCGARVELVWGSCGAAHTPRHCGEVRRPPGGCASAGRPPQQRTGAEATPAGGGGGQVGRWAGVGGLRRAAAGALDRARPGLLRRHALRQRPEGRQAAVAAAEPAGADAAAAQPAGRGALELGVRERVVVVRDEAVDSLAPLALLVEIELLVVAAVHRRLSQLLLLLRSSWPGAQRRWRV